MCCLLHYGNIRHLASFSLAPSVTHVQFVGWLGTLGQSNFYFIVDDFWSTFQVRVSAVVLMSILVLLFVMNWEAIISVVVSIVSICLGIIAYLHLWGVNLDAVSLISILMSVGFSVDYSAHVCYHYFAHSTEECKDHKSESSSVESGSSSSSESINKSLKKSIREHSVKRLVATLHGVGWPVVQSGLSTVMGMFPLMFVRAYVVAVFWKTVLLVGLLGMFHALLLLPVIFILTEDLKRLLRFR
ncbi:hypothetical protein Y032_0050g2005 [Ancylostoma ceylanicum]|uniref:SSD domain-containing protein n=1 Tax=Ancylostoma ceylanicum TaxID=53326 RepID=A0A016U8J3_9BILA|nr:hypothetical protein Y032_0050g2005 [Ancylostoma ceylanicum]